MWAMSSPGASGPQSSGFGSGVNNRPPAPKNAKLEIVVEGRSFSCRDGTIIGAESDFASEVLEHVHGLEARHALLGIEDGYWFILTPRTVKRPFRLDGITLPRGERRSLDRVRHHVEFDSLRLGLRLTPR
jgi:hypothetical protein